MDFMMALASKLAQARHAQSRAAAAEDDDLEQFHHAVVTTLEGERPEAQDGTPTTMPKTTLRHKARRASGTARRRHSATARLTRSRGKQS